MSYDCDVFLDSLWHLSASGRVSGVSAGIEKEKGNIQLLRFKIVF